MAKLAPEWVRTSDQVIRSPARYRWIVIYTIVTVRGFGTPWKTHDNILISWFIQYTCGEKPPENLVPST